MILGSWYSLPTGDKGNRKIVLILVDSPISVYSWKFPSLTGTLALSYFIHNAVLTILRNQKHPENNVRFPAFLQHIT